MFTWLALCRLTLSNVATNAGAVGVAVFFGATFAVALDDPLLFSSMVTSASDGGAL